MLFYPRHLLAAAVMHVALLALLAGGFQFSSKVVAPPVIEAVLLDPSRLELQETKRREQEARRRAAELKREREAEARRQRELEEKKRAEEAARRKKEEQRKLQEQLEQEEARRKEALERAVREEAMRRQLQEEEQARTQAARQTALSQWVVQIRDKVERNWIRPPGAAEDFQCKVRVEQLPGGQITNVRIVESCGNAALDRSVEDAVRRSDPLPVAPDPSIFQRELDFHFKPTS